MLTWDETLSVVRSLEARTPLNSVPDWPARRIDAFPDSEVAVIVAGGCAQSCLACPFPCNGSHFDVGPRSRLDTGSHSSDDNRKPPFCGTLDVLPLRWGYQLPSDGKLVFNTRIERAADSPLWSKSFAERRCIVPVAAFYETSGNESALNPAGRKVKQVYRFGCGGTASSEGDRRNQEAANDEGYCEKPEATNGRDNPGKSETKGTTNTASAPVCPLLLGGIWQDGRFSIMTTEPNELVRPVHDRMPLVLSAQGALAWLAGSADVEELAPSSMKSTPLYPAAPEQGQLALF